jgi:hypothetical protein
LSRTYVYFTAYRKEVFNFLGWTVCCATVFAYPLALDLDSSNHDVVSVTQHCRSHLSLKWTYKVVEGHQDENDQRYHLDERTNLITEMDINAKSHFHIAKNEQQQYNIPGEAWSLWADGNKHVLDMSTNIC